jgi:hypothetical protein
MSPESLVIKATLQRPHREHSAASSLNTATALGLAATLAATVFFFLNSPQRHAPINKIYILGNWEKLLKTWSINQISILWSEGPLDLDRNGKGKDGV